MQQFTVPQFIDVENKVIGFITVRQFIIIMVAGVLIAICYKALYFTQFVIVAVFISFLTGVIAFAKVNGVNFPVFFVNFLTSTIKANVRVWNNAFGKDNLRIETEKVVAREKKNIAPPKNFSASRLTELSLIVDTQGVFRGNKPGQAPLPKYNNDLEKRK